jgi:hypothetical protein
MDIKGRTNKTIGFTDVSSPDEKYKEYSTLKNNVNLLQRMFEMFLNDESEVQGKKGERTD